MLDVLDGAHLSPQLPAGRRRGGPVRLDRGVHRPRRGDRLGGGKRRLRSRLRRGRRHPGGCRGDDPAVPERLMAGAWTQPRQSPPALLPAIAGTVVVILALPVFVLDGWRIRGWALGAVLWVGSQLFGLLLHRLRTRTGNLAAAGVAAFGMMFRAIAVMVV